MLMVVFGAGASYDSSPTHTPVDFATPLEAARPPLANQLFDDRPDFAKTMQMFPKCLPIVPFLRHRTDGSIEQVLEYYQGEVNEYPHRAVQLAAIRWYLHVMLTECTMKWMHRCSGLTNHMALFDEIEHRRTMEDGQVYVVTFNYDRYIESALETIGVSFQAALSDYVNVKSYKLFKLHGSIDWAHKIYYPTGGLPRDPIAAVNALIDLAPTLNLGDRFVVTPQVLTVQPVADGQILFPALAIPVKQKDLFECPPDHVQALEKVIPNVTDLLLVGWSANDRPFLDMLRSGLMGRIPRIVVVAADEGSARYTISNLAEAGVAGSNYAIAYPHTFTHFVLNKAINDVLPRVADEP